MHDVAGVSATVNVVTTSPSDTFDFELVEVWEIGEECTSFSVTVEVPAEIRDVKVTAAKVTTEPRSLEVLTADLVVVGLVLVS